MPVELDFYVDRGELGVYIEKIFERATIRGIADYLLFGSEAGEDNRSYDFDRKSLYSLRYACSCRRNQQNLRK